MGLRESSVKRHIVPCPHCGKEVLDHMEQCPFCQGKLKSKYYTSKSPISKQTKRTMNIVGLAVAIVLIILMLARRYAGG